MYIRLPSRINEVRSSSSSLASLSFRSISRNLIWEQGINFDAADLDLKPPWLGTYTGDLLPARRYKSLPFPLSRPSSPSRPFSRSSCQSRPAQFRPVNGKSDFPDPDAGHTTSSKEDSPSNVSSSQFSDSPRSSPGNPSDKDRNWDLLSSAISSLKSSSNFKNDTSGSSHFSEEWNEGKQSSIFFSRSGNEAFSGIMPAVQKDTVTKPQMRKARVALEEPPAFNEEPCPGEDTQPQYRKGYGHHSDRGPGVKTAKVRSASQDARQVTNAEHWREATMSGQSTDEPLELQKLERAPLENIIHIPFEKPVRRRKDVPENWQEVDMPYPSKVGEETLRYQGKVYGFAAGDKDEVVSGIGAFGPGKLAKEVATRAIKQITAELDACVSSGKGDVGIWKVCEERIFAMLKLFSVEDEVIISTMPQNETISQRTSRKNKRKSRKQHTKNEMNSEAESLDNSQSVNPLDIPPGIPRKPFVLHAFPATLLHALRLLHTHFPMSEITIQMHASIKARGRIARLLASDTDIYNELISYHWHVHNNLPLVNFLLKEMEDNGATISARTMELLNQIFDQKRGEKLISRSSETALFNGTPWASDSTYRAYKDFVGIRGQFEGLFSKVKKLRKFEGHKLKITEKMHRRLPVDIKGSARSEYSRLYRRRGNFMPDIDDEAE
ncbi:hypothetical protein ACJ72_03371 [Emergomyces africanus]|uniref:Mtf2-like C-terminal domain-containing protein n=1 Tax=Emergomyces africanus TaxID=1955775 RepID=A0A1B7P081_9EURO|nr:hypothetical protein ACJ72_03371 [Emergomyces africanus]